LATQVVLRFQARQQAVVFFVAVDVP